MICLACVKFLNTNISEIHVLKMWPEISGDKGIDWFHLSFLRRFIIPIWPSFPSKPHLYALARCMPYGIFTYTA